MPRTLVVLGAAVLWAIPSGASRTDPEACDVLPQDLMPCPRIVGIPTDGDDSPYNDIDITIRAYGGLPLPNVYVEIIFSGGCDDRLCYCDNLHLTGYTDQNGEISFNVTLGGCCELPVSAIVQADALPIRAYDFVVSPDISSATGSGDCQVSLVDFSLFGSGFLIGAAGCTDLTGSCTTTLDDFIVFGSAWGASCSH